MERQSAPRFGYGGAWRPLHVHMGLAWVEWVSLRGEALGVTGSWGAFEGPRRTDAGVLSGQRPMAWDACFRFRERVVVLLGICLPLPLCTPFPGDGSDPSLVLDTVEDHDILYRGFRGRIMCWLCAWRLALPPFTDASMCSSSRRVTVVHESK